MTDEPVAPRRGPGRPPKVIPKVEPKTWNMKNKPNWEEYSPSEEETPDRFRIDRSLWPEGMDLLWVTASVLGQPTDDRRRVFEQGGGWTPVHQTDFDGQF